MAPPVCIWKRCEYSSARESLCGAGKGWPGHVRNLGSGVGGGAVVEGKSTMEPTG